MDTRQSPGTPRPVVVHPGERVAPPGQQTTGMRREQAFIADDRWVGLVNAGSGDWSGWHHHGATDTYFYVLGGGIEFEYGTDGVRTTVGPGDFCHVPAGLAHRERARAGEQTQVVLVRIGAGPPVVNLEGPTG